MLFVSFAASITLFALVTAVVFSLFWVGVALVFLAPTLFVTGSVAVLVWLWVVSAFVFARWLYNLLPASSSSASARNGAPPPAGRKQVPGSWSNPTKREHPNGAGAYVESDTDYRDALVKSKNGGSE